MSKRLIALVSGIVLLVLLGACAPAAVSTPTAAPAAKDAGKPAAAASSPTTASSAAKPTAKPLEKVKVHIPTKTVGRLEFYFGKAKGIFAEEGLDLEILVLQSNLGLPALLKGELDYTTLTSSSFQALLKGEPIVTYMEIKSNNSWYIFGRPGVTSGKELEGKPIALSSREGSNSFAADKALRSLGLDPSKNSIITIAGYGEMLAALKSGSVWAASLSSPDNYKAAAEGLKLLVDTKDIVTITSSSLASTQKTFQEKPDQVKRMIRAVLKSLSYMREHKDEAVQFVMKEFELDKTMAEAVFNDEMALRSKIGNVTDTGLESHLEILKRAEKGLENVTVDALKKGVDVKLLQQAQKELGLTQ